MSCRFCLPVFTQKIPRDFYLSLTSSFLETAALWLALEFRSFSAAVAFETYVWVILFFFLFFSFFSSVWYSGLLIILLSRRSPINLGVFWIAVSIVVAKIASFITYWLSISVVVWWSAHCLPGLLLIDREKSSLRFSLFSFQSSEWAHWLLMRTNEWLWLDFHPDSPVICESSRIERYSLESRGIFSRDAGHFFFETIDGSDSFALEVWRRLKLVSVWRSCRASEEEEWGRGVGGILWKYGGVDVQFLRIVRHWREVWEAEKCFVISEE